MKTWTSNLYPLGMVLVIQRIEGKKVYRFTVRPIQPPLKLWTWEISDDEIRKIFKEAFDEKG